MRTGVRLSFVLLSSLPLPWLAGCNALFGIEQLTSGEADAGAMEGGILRFEAASDEDAKDPADAHHESLGEGSTDGDSADGSCTLGSQCQDTWVCDPVMRRCVPEECKDDSNSCGTDQTCVLQYHETTSGACYTACLPFVAGACPAADVCIPVTSDGSEGACFPTGTIALGDPCVVSDVQSNCVQGTQCIDTTVSGWKCTSLCDYWGSSLYCTGSDLCGPMYSCLDPATGDSAAIGSPCSAGAELLQVCGSDGRRFKGACVKQQGAALQCFQACRTDTSPINADCPSGQVCSNYPGLPDLIGICE